MAHARPIAGSIAAGAVTKAIPLNRHASRTSVDVVLTGVNTFSIESTLDSIHWNTADLASAINLQPRGASYADPTTAAWVEEQASASATSTLKLNQPVAAIRIVKTVGAGTAEYRIQQT